MAYSLSCGHQQNLTLKTKQEEALFPSVQWLWGGGMFTRFSNWLQKVNLLQTMFHFKLMRTNAPQAD